MTNGSGATILMSQRASGVQGEPLTVTTAGAPMVSGSMGNTLQNKWVRLMQGQQSQPVADQNLANYKFYQQRPGTQGGMSLNTSSPSNAMHGGKMGGHDMAMRVRKYKQHQQQHHPQYQLHQSHNINQ